MPKHNPKQAHDELSIYSVPSSIGLEQVVTCQSQKDLQILGSTHDLVANELMWRVLDVSESWSYLSFSILAYGLVAPKFHREASQPRFCRMEFHTPRSRSLVFSGYCPPPFFHQDNFPSAYKISCTDPMNPSLELRGRSHSIITVS